MTKYILAIDQGTTSTRAILFDRKGNQQHIAQKEINLIYRKSGWVEVDALEIWLSTIAVINEVLITANISYDQIDSVGITNQRETTVVWDKKTGMPVSKAIVWQSSQTQYLCDERAKFKEIIQKKTGLPLNPYFSATKIRFILDHIPNGQKRAKSGELMAGTIDSWLLYRLTNNTSFCTDVSNASRTLLYNINDCCWDEELLRIFNIPLVLLPMVKPSSHNFGVMSFLGTNIPICGIAGDQQASLFGHTCFQKGESKNTYGTGCFMLLNTGNKPCVSQNGLISSIGWQIGDEVTYVLEGSVFIGGAAVQWLRDELKVIPTVDFSEDCAFESNPEHEIFVVPAFTGLGAPYWDSLAKGAIFGIERNTERNDIIRATLEAIAAQSKDVFHAMERDTKLKITHLCVDGGASKNNYLLQFQANILNIPVKRPVCYENTALGVCFLSGLQTGFFKDLNEIKKLKKDDTVFKPMWDKDRISSYYEKWQTAVKATRIFKK